MDTLKKALNIQFTQERWDGLFNEMDINQNGYVDLNEFIMACSICMTDDFNPTNDQNNNEFYDYY